MVPWKLAFAAAAAVIGPAVNAHGGGSFLSAKSNHNIPAANRGFFQKLSGKVGGGRSMDGASGDQEDELNIASGDQVVR